MWLECLVESLAVKKIFKFHLFERRSERGREKRAETKGEKDLPSVFWIPPSSCDRQDWAGLRSAARNFILVSHMIGK